MERFAQNNRIQGSAALMTKIAHILIDDTIEKNNLQDFCYVVGLIHDEIVGESDIKYKDIMKEIMQTSMIKAGSMFCKTIPMIADPEVSFEWKH